MMKALILNSGTGSRLGHITKTHPKCMTVLDGKDTILSRQMRFLQGYVREVIITTGPYEEQLRSCAESFENDLSVRFVHNPDYRSTNYIYSIYLAREHLDDDLLLMHGDLVFAPDVLADIMRFQGSCAVTSSEQPLPEKDFKAVIRDGKIVKVGVDCFENAVFMQPLYKLLYPDWRLWLDEIGVFCKRGERGCYAENALNEVSDRCNILPFDIGMRLCGEIDTPEDLERMRSALGNA